MEVKKVKCGEKGVWNEIKEKGKIGKIEERINKERSVEGRKKRRDRGNAYWKGKLEDKLRK